MQDSKNVGCCPNKSRLERLFCSESGIPRRSSLGPTGREVLVVVNGANTPAYHYRNGKSGVGLPKSSGLDPWASVIRVGKFW